MHSFTTAKRNLQHLHFVLGDLDHQECQKNPKNESICQKKFKLTMSTRTTQMKCCYAQ